MLKTNIMWRDTMLVGKHTFVVVTSAVQKYTDNLFQTDTNQSERENTNSSTRLVQYRRFSD